jgi:hypothetical protein
MTGRRVRIRTEHDDPAVAERIAAALRPDNTAEMATTVDGGAIETAIERETTGGLRATADDYVVNLRVATELANTETHDT